jgi:hypothetical protein
LEKLLLRNAEEHPTKKISPMTSMNMVQPQTELSGQVLYRLDFLTLHQADHSLFAIHPHTSTIPI